MQFAKPVAVFQSRLSARFAQDSLAGAPVRHRHEGPAESL